VTTFQVGAIPGKLVVRGNLISQLTMSQSLTGVIAVAGDVGAIQRTSSGAAVTNSSGQVTRFGGITIGGTQTSGVVFVLGNVLGDLSVGGTLTGRIAVQGYPVSGLAATRLGILGNLSVGGVGSTAVIISGGEIGDAIQGTSVAYSGAVQGFIASIGATRYGNSQMTSGHTFQNLVPSNFNAIAIAGIWSSGGQPPVFDIAPLDLQGLNRMLAALANVRIVPNATPTVAVADAGGVYTGLPYAASATVTGTSGPASPSLEGVAPTLIYYSGSTASGTPLSGAPSSAGTYTVVASFAGSANYAAATSSAVTFRITTVTPRVTVIDAGGVYTGSTFAATATVTGISGIAASSLEGVTPTFTYYSGTTASGRALSGAPSTVGTYTVVASFAGSTDYTSATSSALTFKITVATPTVAVTGGGAYTGSPVPAIATVTGASGTAASSLEGVTPSLTYYSGSTATGTPLSGAPSAIGTYTVVANFAGSADYTSATSGAVTFNITPATPRVTVIDAGGVYSASSYAATATVTGVTGGAASSLEGVTPTLTYYSGSTATGTPLSGAPSAVGTYTVVASFAGSAHYIATSSAVTFRITAFTPLVTAAEAGGVYTGSPFAATATVAGVSRSAVASLEGVTPTFTYYAGSTASGTPLSGAPTAVGTYTVVANFAGSADYAAATSSAVTFRITAATPRVVAVDAGGVHNGSPFAATATVTGVSGIAASSLEGVTPTFTYYSGSTASGRALSGAPSTAGTYTVVASFAGSADYTSATSIAVTFRIT
jgi:hypothetical protein